MEKTWKPTTAGILSIIAGTMGIGGGIFMIVAGRLIGRLSQMLAGVVDIPSIIIEATGVAPNLIAPLGAIPLTFGIIAIIGGIYAIKRRRWGLALTGSILALVGSGVLGVLAIIFVSLGKREFE